MSSGDDHSHHPRQGHALKWTTEEISESLAGLHLALYQVFLQRFEWLLTLCHSIMEW